MSVLLNLRDTERNDGSDKLSVAISRGDNMDDVYKVADWQVNSLECRKPVKPSRQAAHNIILI
jgi:hypothetical protein